VGVPRQLCRVVAAVASGTSSVMGAPVGALVFSMEVTASYYLVR
jgi:H+/Cl- antiporter ClcA